MPEQQRHINREQFEGILRNLIEAAPAEGQMARQGNLQEVVRHALAQNGARRRNALPKDNDPRKSMVAMRLLRHLVEGVPDLSAVVWWAEHAVNSGDFRQLFVKQLVDAGLVVFRDGVAVATDAGFAAVKEAYEEAGLQGAWAGIDGIPRQPGTWVWTAGGDEHPAACDVIGDFRPEQGRFIATFPGAHGFRPFLDRLRLIRCERGQGGVCKVTRVVDMNVVRHAGVTCPGAGQTVTHLFTYAECRTRDIELPVRLAVPAGEGGPNRIYTDDPARVEATVKAWKDEGRDVRVGYCPLLSPDFDMAVESGADHIYLRVPPDRAQEMLHRFREKGVVIWDARGQRHA